MTYDQLLPVYQQVTGLPGQDDAFNQWVQGIINASGSQQGVEGIPNNFFQTPQGQQYISSTTTMPQNSGSPGSVGQIPSTGGVGGALSGLTNGNSLIQNLGNYGGGDLGGMVQNTLAGGVQRANAGGNTNQVQGGAQTGTYQNVGNTTGTQQQTGTQNTTGSQTGNQQTNQQTTGTSTTQVNNAYGLGNLLNNLTTQTGASDAARSQFLTGAMQNGNPALQSQVDQAVRNSLTGPQMTGAGDSARARAAGYAAAQVGRNSMDQQLQAASLLGQAGAGTQVLQAGAPYAGSTTSNSENTLGNVLNTLNSNQSTNTSENTSSNQNQQAAGNATGSSLGIATGQTPQQTSSGGCFVCSAFNSMRLINEKSIKRAVAHKLFNLKTYETSLLGYSIYGPWLAEQVLDSSWMATLLLPISRAILWHENTLALPTRFKRKLVPQFWHGVFHYGSWPLGVLGRISGQSIALHNQRIKSLLVKHDLLFQWEGSK